MHGRPVVSRIFAMRILRLIADPEIALNWDIRFIAAVSDDASAEVCATAGLPFIRHENLPLGAKWNAGLVAGLEQNPDADYVLITGDDDMLGRQLFEGRFLELARERHPYFGIQSIYFVDAIRRRCVVFRYRTSKLIGCGRFISVSAIMKAGMKVPVRFRSGFKQYDHQNTPLQLSALPQVQADYLARLNPVGLEITGPPRLQLWDPDINSSLDHSSEVRLVRAGFIPTIVADPAGRPLVADMKTDVNIWKWDQVRVMASPITYQEFIGLGFLYPDELVQLEEIQRNPPRPPIPVKPGINPRQR